MNKKLNLVLAAALMGVSLLTGCGSSSTYQNPGSDYKVVDDIPGIKFAIPSIVAQATAITKVSDDVNFDYSNTYSYKDGENNYVLFNMSSIVILCQKGTNFNFDESDNKTETVTSAPIMNTWFESTEKKLNYTESESGGTYKIIADTSAGVTINTDVYGDFIGKIAVIDTGDEEYALFVGVPQEVYESESSARNIINSVALSMQVNSEEKDVTTYEIVTGGNLENTDMVEADTEDTAEDSSNSESSIEIIEDNEEENTEEVEEIIVEKEQEENTETTETAEDENIESNESGSEENEEDIITEVTEEQSTEDSTEEKEEENDKEENTVEETEESNASSTSNVSSTEISDESNVEASNESNIEASDEYTSADENETSDSSQEESSEELEENDNSNTEASKEEIQDTEGTSEVSETVEENTEEQETTETSEVHEGLNLDNQKKNITSDDEYSYSNIYSTLSVGHGGYTMACDSKGSMQQVGVKLEEVFTGDEADQLITKYANNNTTKLNITKAPDGTHYEVAKFSVDKSSIADNTDIYMDVKFTGLDGEKPYFHGVGYDTRTYDMNIWATEKGDITEDLYVFYIVPNGCNEYMLIFGDVTSDTSDDIIGAYYDVKTD